MTNVYVFIKEEGTFASTALVGDGGFMSNWTTVKERAEKILDFQEGEVYVAIVLQRKKYNEEIAKSSRVIQREILDKEHWEAKLKKLFFLVTQYEGHKYMNLYLQINPRSARRGIFNLKNLLNVWELQGSYDPYEHLVSHWLSCLERKSARSRRNYYLVDVDTKDSELLQRMRDFLVVYEQLVVETRNGFHIIARPFDTQKFHAEFNSFRDYDVKTDDAVCLWCGDMEDE